MAKMVPNLGPDQISYGPGAKEKLLALGPQEVKQLLGTARRNRGTPVVTKQRDVAGKLLSGTVSVSYQDGTWTIEAKD